MSWSELSDSYRNSVVKIRAVQRNIDRLRPHLVHDEQVVLGTGFLVDLVRGYILTTANIVYDPIVITCSFQHMKGRTFSLNLISLTQVRNIALCQIPEAELATIKSWFKGNQFNPLKFGDSYKVKELEELLVISYPDDNIRISVCRPSAFKIIRHSKIRKDYDDVYRRDPSYIQLDTLYSPTMNGSPIINSQGRVIAMVASSIDNGIRSLAILSRAILSINSQLLSGGDVQVPNTAFEWCRTSRELNQDKCGDSSVSGICIRNLYPDSTFGKMASGDIIVKLDYTDPYWKHDSPISFVPDTTKSEDAELACFFDRYGNVILNIKSTNPTDGKAIYSRCLDRMLDISEVFDAVPYGTKMGLYICRNKKWYDIPTVYETRPSNRVLALTPSFTKPKHIVFSGLVCTNLNQAQLTGYPRLKLYSSAEPNFWYGQRVIISQILPGSRAENLYVLAEGDLIIKVNGTAIKTIDDIKRLLTAIETPDKLIIETDDRSIYVGAITDNKVAADTLMKIGLAH